MPDKVCPLCDRACANCPSAALFECPALGGNAEARSARNELDALALLNRHWLAQHVAAQGSAGGHADGNGLADRLLALSEDAGGQLRQGRRTAAAHPDRDTT
ncbi:MAG: hypothetical protein MZW92_52375 [Comamonadaceae bacterium]|nr:hypothetical protein [Comamonadaceae bacterium]